MYYRTKTYIAGDWTTDIAVVNKLREWNTSKYWSLSFTDAHDITHARDSSLNCSIKSSLKTRLDASKTFVLIVGDKTKSLTAGSCQHCPSYNSWTKCCARYHSVDYRSFITYECEVAARDIDKIVVIYNSTYVDKSKCPDAVKNIGTHIPAYYYIGTEKYWNYDQIKKALG